MTTWTRPEVAKGQFKLANDQWQHLNHLRPYLYFAKAMTDIICHLKEVRLLDVGCGVGHYGRFCQHYFPRVHYDGCDLSEAMIGYARNFATQGRFSVCDILDAPYENHNCVLFSGVIEYAENPLDILVKAISCADDYATIILHRFRLTGHQSRPIPEETYAGYVENHYLWNQVELFAALAALLNGIRHVDWYEDTQSTIYGQVIP